MDFGDLLTLLAQLYTILLLRKRDVSPRKKYNLMPRLVNLGSVAPIPAVNTDVEIAFAFALLQMYRKNEIIKLTEGEWVTNGKWKTLGGGKPQNFRDLLDKWNTERIVERASQAKNAAWILSRGWVSKLKKKCKEREAK